MDTPTYTTPEAAQLATRWRRALSGGAAAVKPCTIRQWVTRGHLTACGLDERGPPLYALPDLAQAEYKTRTRALILASAP
ncbi:MerR family transcriptional regulator [Streptomyces sp. NPDC091972]|uniref:MerR family transcriptional regulator n=1 Tax=Streptomyces sp. NPDC091972 TaxID=3366007 RepID=UPI00380F0B51